MSSSTPSPLDKFYITFYLAIIFAMGVGLLLTGIHEGTLRDQTAHAVALQVEAIRAAHPPQSRQERVMQDSVLDCAVERAPGRIYALANPKRVLWENAPSPTQMSQAMAQTLSVCQDAVLDKMVLGLSEAEAETTIRRLTAL